MLTTLMLLAAAFSATQLRPQTTLDRLPDPKEEKTRTAYSGVPGETPTTPMPVSLAATMPETWVPCPLPSLVVLPPPSRAPRRSPVAQSKPPTTLRSGRGMIPVSRMATAAFFSALAHAGQRGGADPHDPGGHAAAPPAAASSRRTGRSGVTKATRGSRCRLPRRSSGSDTTRVLTELNSELTVAPSVVARPATASALAESFRTTM